MNHKGTRELTTERLTLRRFRIEDAEAMFRNWASDDEVTRYLTWPSHENVETTEALLQSWAKGYEEETRYLWAIVPKGGKDEPIGSISVVSCTEKTNALGIGYCMGKAYWYQGIMAEALKSVIAYLFEEVGANRIEASHDVNNPNSGRVMVKAGMTREGVLRQAGRNQQGICDMAYYSILREEYSEQY